MTTHQVTSRLHLPIEMAEREKEWSFVSAQFFAESRRERLG